MSMDAAMTLEPLTRSIIDQVVGQNVSLATERAVIDRDPGRMRHSQVD